MKVSSVLLFAGAAMASAVPQVEARQESLVECCYKWTAANGGWMLFRSSSERAGQGGRIFDKNGHCIASFQRDAQNPNDCAAPVVTIVGGYCTPIDSKLEVASCDLANYGQAN